MLPALAEQYLRLHSQAAQKAELKEAISSVERHHNAGIETPVTQQENDEGWLHGQLAISALGTNIGNTPGN